jgi:hypothetical protein
MRECGIQDLPAILGLAELRLIENLPENEFQPAAQHGVIVCNKDSHGCPPLLTGPAGIRTRTVVHRCSR